jgi:hypothetical protein
MYALAGISSAGFHARCDDLRELLHASSQGMVDSNGEPVDAAFYRRFWGLQPVFMNPGPAMRPGPWAGVMTDLTAVLDEFDKQKTIAAASSAPDAEGEGCFYAGVLSPVYPLDCCRCACSRKSSCLMAAFCGCRRGTAGSKVPEQPQADAAAAAGRNLQAALPCAGVLSIITVVSIWMQHTGSQCTIW